MQRKRRAKLVPLLQHICPLADCFTLPANTTRALTSPRYKNLDKLIHYANQDGRLNAFYSTPAA